MLRTNKKLYIYAFGTNNNNNNIIIYLQIVRLRILKENFVVKSAAVSIVGLYPDSFQIERTGRR